MLFSNIAWWKSRAQSGSQFSLAGLLLVSSTVYTVWRVILIVGRWYSFLTEVRSTLNGPTVSSQLWLNYSSTAKSSIQWAYPGLHNYHNYHNHRHNNWACRFTSSQLAYLDVNLHTQSTCRIIACSRLSDSGYEAKKRMTKLSPRLPSRGHSLFRFVPTIREPGTG